MSQFTDLLAQAERRNPQVYPVRLMVLGKTEGKAFAEQFVEGLHLGVFPELKQSLIDRIGTALNIQFCGIEVLIDMKVESRFDLFS